MKVFIDAEVKECQSRLGQESMKHRANLFLLCFGKLKTPGFQEAWDHYEHLLTPWVALQVTEIKAPSTSLRSTLPRTQVREREQSLFEEHLKRQGGGAFFLLDEGGKAFSTQGWKQFFEIPQRNFIFCLGSAFGTSPELKQKATQVFSFGPQTLSHELARLVWIEQVYRAWSLLKGHPYHQEG